MRRKISNAYFSHTPTKNTFDLVYKLVTDSSIVLVIKL